MRYYLDTNICIYFLNGTKPRVKEQLLSRKPSDIVIPAIVKAELLYGAAKSQRHKENRERVLQLLSPLRIAAFGDDASVAYSTLRARLESEGTPIGPNDLIVASTVLAENGTLITNNTKEFERVPDLRLEDWTR